MRTTLTIDDNIERRIRKRAAKLHKPFKAVTNELLRVGLEVQEQNETQPRPFKVKAKHCSFCPGIDQEKLNQVLDDTLSEDHLKS